MRLFDWLLRRKPARKPPSEAEALRLAFEELGRRHHERQKHQQLRRHHTDDFRELRIDHADPEHLPEDLLHLTADTYEHRADYRGQQDEQTARVDLTQPSGAADGATEAARASEAAKADMEKKGIKLREHYYRTAERQQTGEIQETFEVPPAAGDRTPPTRKDAEKD